MEELINTVNDVAEGAVTPQNEGEAAVEAVGATQSASAAPESAAPAQTPEQNRWFAEQRRAAEAAKTEARRAKEESKRLIGALSGYGYRGSPQEIADQIEAASRHISIDQLRAGREQEARRRTEAVQSDPGYRQATREAESLREIVHKNIRARDADEINRTFGEKLRDATELGEQYTALRAAGVSNLVAYNAVRQAQEVQKAKRPPSIGAVNQSGGGSKDYYSPDEVDRLTPAQLDNPRILKSVQKSMTKWR